MYAIHVAIMFTRNTCVPALRTGIAYNMCKQRIRGHCYCC